MNFYPVGSYDWGDADGDVHCADGSGDGGSLPFGSGAGAGIAYIGKSDSRFYGPGIHFGYGWRHDDTPLLSTIEVKK